MAKNLSKLLKAQMPSSPKISDIAELVRRHGRGRDTVLAHITPKEAALLKARGGRGSRNPHTGLLEFDDFTDFTAPTTFSETPANFTAPTLTSDVITQPATTYSGPDYTTQAPDTFSQTAPSYSSSFSYPVSILDNTPQTTNTSSPSYFQSGLNYLQSLGGTPYTNVAPSVSGAYGQPVQQPQLAFPPTDWNVVSNQFPITSGYGDVNSVSSAQPQTMASLYPVQQDQGTLLAQNNIFGTQPANGILNTPTPTQVATNSPAPSPTTAPAPAPSAAPQQVAETQFPENVPIPTPRPTDQQLGLATPDTSTPTSDPTKFVAKAGQDANDAASISSKTGSTGQAVNQLMAANGIDVTKNPQLLPQMTAISDGLKNGTITVAQAGQMMQNIANNQTLSGSVSNWLSQPANQFKMAIGLAGAAFGALMYNNQVNQAKQVQAQIQAASANASSQLQQMAQPILSQVNFGPTASDIQQIQAAQAQAAQASANAGSVGAAQQQRTIQDYVTRLADNRMQQNLQAFGAAAPYLTNAINVNLQGTIQGLNASLGIQQQAQSAVGNFAAGLARLFV